MRTRLFPPLCALLTLLACGGSVPVPEPPDAATPQDAGEDAGKDVGQEANPCECLGADFGTLVCNGVQRPDAESCAICGGHCNSTPDAGGE